MSLIYMLFLAISLQVKLVISCQPPQNCKNVTSKNNTQIIETVICGVSNISCGLGKVCRGGFCIDVEYTEAPRTEDFLINDLPYRTEGEVLTTLTSHKRGEPTKSSHGLISGNQEFVIALVGFSILFINFCLISLCLAHLKRRRLQRQQQQQQQRSATTQSSQTVDDWDGIHVIRNRGIENFALNGELDAFGSEFMYAEVHLPPYDFSSAYHKPRPRSEDSEENGGEEESSGEAIENQSIPINEDPPPYSEQRYEGSACQSPPSYEEALKVLATNTEESSSGL